MQDVFVLCYFFSVASDGYCLKWIDLKVLHPLLRGIDEIATSSNLYLGATVFGWEVYLPWSILLTASWIRVNMFCRAYPNSLSISCHCCQATGLVINKTVQLIHQKTSGFVLLHVASENWWCSWISKGVYILSSVLLKINAIYLSLIFNTCLE